MVPVTSITDFFAILISKLDDNIDLAIICSWLNIIKTKTVMIQKIDFLDLLSNHLVTLSDLVAPLHCLDAKKCTAVSENS